MQVAGFSTLLAEEARSARLGREEDRREEAAEAARLAAKAAKMAAKKKMKR